ALVWSCEKDDITPPGAAPPGVPQPPTINPRHDATVMAVTLAADPRSWHAATVSFREMSHEEHYAFRSFQRGVHHCRRPRTEGTSGTMHVRRDRRCQRMRPVMAQRRLCDGGC